MISTTLVRVAALTLITGCCGVAGALPAQPAPPLLLPARGGPPPWTLWRNAPLQRRLGVTADQRERLRRLDQRTEAALRALHLQRHRIHQGMERAFALHPVDRHAVRVHGESLAASFKSELALMLEARVALHEILSEEQLRSLDTMPRPRPPAPTPAPVPR